MTTKEIVKLIDEYKEANITWYTNQSNQKKLNRLNRFRRCINGELVQSDITHSKYLSAKFYLAMFGTTNIKPAS